MSYPDNKEVLSTTHTAGETIASGTDNAQARILNSMQDQMLPGGTHDLPAHKSSGDHDNRYDGRYLHDDAVRLEGRLIAIANPVVGKTYTVWIPPYPISIVAVKGEKDGGGSTGNTVMLLKRVGTTNTNMLSGNFDLPDEVGNGPAVLASPASDVPADVPIRVTIVALNASVPEVLYLQVNYLIPVVG